MDQIALKLGGRTPPDYSVTIFHYRRLPFAIQLNLRSPHLGKNQSHYLYLSPDNEVSYFDWDRRGERRSEGLEVIICNGNETK